MSTVTSFSASLLQSLEGNTVQAAKYADKAVTDMADNANKMGTSMEMIQNAYQGFAKGNYTMLDNLKLGYGGTQSEMQRLIARAAELSDTVDAQSMSFANIVEAIHVVQDEMGITGTTAAEASTTIQGSVASMKAAWKNLVLGFTDSNADLGKRIDEFVVTVIGDGTDKNPGVFGNIFPAIERSLVGIGSFIERIAPIISEKLPDLVTQVLPSLLSAATTLVNGLVNAAPSILQVLIDQAPTILNTIITEALGLLPELLGLAVQFILAIAEGLADNSDLLIPAIVTTILTIVDTLTDPDTLGRLLNAAITIIKSFAAYLVQPDTLDLLLSAVIDIVDSFVTFVMDNLGPLLDAAIEIIMSLTEYLMSPENIAKLVAAAVEIVAKLAFAIYDARFQIGVAALELIENLINEFVNTDWGEVGGKIVNGIWNGIKNAWSDLSNWVSDSWNRLVGVFTGEETTPDIEFEPDRSGNSSDIDVSSWHSAVSAGSGLSGNGSKTSATGGSTARPTNIILTLNDRELGRAVYALNQEESERVGLDLAEAY